MVNTAKSVAVDAIQGWNIEGARRSTTHLGSKRQEQFEADVRRTRETPEPQRRVPCSALAPHQGCVSQRSA